MTKWQLKERAPEEFIKKFPEYSPLILELLYHRGLKTADAIDDFFNPDYKDLHDPFLMLGMDKAVKRIKQAIKKKEKIAIFGDYDADGVCGVIVLKTVLEELGANLGGGTYVPDRKIEGYGLNNSAIKKMAAKGAKLILTVDCGVSDQEEIRLANELGMEVVVTDHHQITRELPPALAVINPWQAKDKYPFKELCGAAVAFKLAHALAQKSKKIKPGWEKWLLDLVALATVGDCMPLLGENRILVRYGLIVLAQTKRLGLQELMKVARLNPIIEIEKLYTNLDAYSLGFVLAPRLNAAGRIHHASLALELLEAKERDEAARIARQINDHNSERQRVTNEIVQEIETRLKKNPASQADLAIIQSDKNWSPGVIGLVAGKICDRYLRPTFVFCEGEVTSRGSARSPEDFNIVEAIGQCQNLIVEFGGHPTAAGLEIKNKNIAAFAKKINELVGQKLKGRELTAQIMVDLEIEPKEIDWALFDDLLRLEPFGNSNEPPIFLIKDLEVAGCRTVGSTAKHLKMELKSDNLPGKVFKAIGFNLANGAKNDVGDLKVGDRVDILFELIADEWNGTRSLQLKIEDIKKR